MSSSSMIPCDNDLPPAFSMWKMFHSTITVLFKNLDNAENNLQALANTILSSKEFSDIFIPRFDSSVSLSENQSVEKKYQAFTTWLLSRLFYLLSCEKFERIHNLFIDAQLKILDVLRLNLPHVYNAMVSEYNTALTTIVNHLSIDTCDENFDEKILSLNNFIADNTVIKEEDLDLSPIFVQINSKLSCFLMQQKLVKILSTIAVGYVDTSWLDSLTISILKNIIHCFQTPVIGTKLIIIQYFTQLLNKSYFKIKDSPALMKHFREMLLHLEQFVCNFHLTIQYFSLEDLRSFEIVIRELFQVIIKLKIVCDNPYAREKCRNISEFLILYKLKESSLFLTESNTLQASMELLKCILEYETAPFENCNLLIQFALDKKSCNEIDILLEYQICHELQGRMKQKNALIVATDTSNTWNLLYTELFASLEYLIANRCDISVVASTLNFMYSIMRCARNIHIHSQEWYCNNHCKNSYHRLQIKFITLPYLLTKIRKIINIYSINTSHEMQDCLDSIVKIFSCIILFTNFSKNNFDELKAMLEIISYPFWNHVQLAELSLSKDFLITPDFNEEKCIQKQIESLEILSHCMFNIESNEQQPFTTLKTWILNIFKHCTVSDNEQLLCQASKNLLQLISILRGSPDYLYDLLKQLISLNNTNVLRIVSASLGKIICVFSVNYTISPVFHDKDVEYEPFCLQCDFFMSAAEDDNQILCRKTDHKVFKTSQFIVQKNYVQVANFSMLFNFLSSNDIDVKRNIVKQLPRFVKHINKFNTPQITKEWLKLMIDEDAQVRANFNVVVKSVVENCQNNESHDASYKKEMLNICLKTLQDISQRHIRSSDVELLESLLQSIKEFGCLSSPTVLYTTSKLLLFYLILCNSYLSLIAIDHLNRVSTAHGITPAFLFTKYKKNFCKTLAEMSVYCHCTLQYNIVQSFERMALAFGFTMKDFVTRNCHHLLPYFIPLFVKVPESSKILNDFANLMILESSDLLASNFAYIYTHIYLHESEAVFNKSMRFIENVTKSTVSSLKRRSIKVIHNELLIHFHDKRDLVLKELQNLSQEDSESNSDCSTHKSSKSMQQISDYLQPRFLGVLVYFDSKLVSKNVDESVKIRVLQSLPEIIKLMGSKYITPLRFKVLATLRTALSLTEEQYLELICNNWEAFVHCCEPDSLGALLSTIFVSILPLNKLFPRKINAIFKYLVIENEEKVKDNIQDLFFVSETNASSEVKSVIKKHVLANRPYTFRAQLILFLKYINHENLEVRIYGLKFLKKYLEEKHSELEDMVLGNNGMDSVLVELIDVLIAGCRENDDKIRLASGECIGELGAIEPSHFPRKYTQADSNFTFYISDDSFVVNALMELLRSFQMEKHTQNMNRFALAIQEILKAYGVSPDSSAPKNNLWSSFPENMQELMLPLLSSKYTVAIQSSDKVTVHPIYGSHIGSSFNDWIYNWTSYLISILTNEKRSLLQVCKPSLKYDYRTLMFFLPHILIHALLECGDEERSLVYNEFLTVLNLSNTGTKLSPEHLKYYPLKTKEYVPSNTIKKSDDNSKNNCIKVIFVLLDYLDRWLREYECTKTPKTSNSSGDVHYKVIHDFMSLFCKLKIAQCNFVRGEYPRALMYLEQHVARDKKKLNEQLGFFARIYAELEEPDGVAGAMAIQETEPSLEDMILAHSVSGQLQDAAACYERLAQEHTLKPQYLREMVRCYLELDNPFTAFNIAQGAMENYPEYKTMLYESQAEPFWRLSMYDELSDLLKKSEIKNNSSWGVRMGQALVHFRNGNRTEFRGELNNIRKMLIEMLSITSLEEGVYRHGYPHIIKLHILNEIQKAEETMYKIMELKSKNISEQSVHALVDEWDVRLKVVQASVRVVEPILRLRRIILEQSQVVLGPHAENVKTTLNKHIAKYWLKSAEIARQATIFQQAYIYILKAEQYKPMELFIEKTKLFWAKEEQELAFNTLKRGIEEHFPDAATFKEMGSNIRKSDRKLCAEAKLLIATYNDETSNVDMDVNISNYKEAVDIYREWENSQVCLAQYYDRVFSTMSDEDKDIKGGDIQVHIINCFGKSLQYGSKYIYQSMPRMLSIWFDYGTRIVESRPTDDTTTREAKKSTLFKMIKLMDTYLDRLPAYMFLSAFSQLVSRICHPVREVYTQIKSILIKLILKYPQQSMWNILAVSKSAYAMRTKRCQEVLQDPRLKNSTKVMRLIYDFNRLAEKLIELCNKPISDGVVTTSVNTLIRSLPRLLQTKDFSEIILPIQTLRKLVLPNPDHSNSQHDPFPNAYVYIMGIEDEVSVLQSLQRPRKITFRGSDGNKYIHMLKPKDDLRKDTRLMEFNDVVNLYLHREAESRQRRLCIRTYSVVPLNEECGIVEWVNHLVGLRPILMKIYKQKGSYVGARELKSMMCNVRDSLARKRHVFETQLLPRHPPVLAEWFRRTFPDAHRWYEARAAYVRTGAVISMVGYILGLGDRHGENILFDATNGDTVHVDFNCLFNKGESFDWPERVPFRLTHNMVDAMGPLGVEGIFRKSCAVTLKVLRTHTDTLMSIVRPFVYDPLVSWPRNQLLKSDLAEAERTNEQAMEHIRNIELRLQGMIKNRGKSFSISLSCEGQANNLILEATCVDNLSQMYMGWGPFL